MGRVIRTCRKGKGSVFTSHATHRKGAAKHRNQVRDTAMRIDRTSDLSANARAWRANGAHVNHGGGMERRAKASEGGLRRRAVFFFGRRREWSARARVEGAHRGGCV